MWVICFYLNANKKALSETVIRGCGRGGKREERKRVLVPLPSFLSSLLLLFDKCLLVPAASLCLFLSATPQAASGCIPALHF